MRSSPALPSAARAHIRQRFDRSTLITMTLVSELEYARSAVRGRYRATTLPLGNPLARLRDHRPGRRSARAASSISAGTIRCSARSRSRNTCRRRSPRASPVRRPSSRRSATSIPSAPAWPASSTRRALLAHFDHPSLAKVYRFWEENGTAYMVMLPHYEGPTLKTTLAEARPCAERRRAADVAKADPSTPSPSFTRAARSTSTSAPTRSCRAPVGPILLGFASGGARDRGDPPHPCGRAQAGLRRDRAIRRGSRQGARPMDRSVRPRRGRLRGDHRRRAGRRRRPSRQRASAPADRGRAGLYSAGFLAAIDAAMARSSRSNGRPTTASSRP